VEVKSRFLAGDKVILSPLFPIEGLLPFIQVMVETEDLDTMSLGGKLIFHIFGALAEFERDIIRERTTAGLRAVRARGRRGRRPKALTA
jgi:DNA invertase Pin-like site-specific DNA recombinase